MRTRGVGDFDTSDLPGGSRPTNVRASTRAIGDTLVETLRADTVNGYSVTVNRYGDRKKLQVFIDNVALDTSIVGYVSLDELDGYIRSHTR